MAALTYADRVKETTATTGTGTITLAGAASGFQAFSVIGNGSKCYYRIEDGTAWEIGIGTYTSSGTTLSRDVILASTNSGSALNLSGTATVYHDIPAVFFKDQVRHVQARVAATANVTLATACENGDTLNGVVLATGDVIFTPYQSTAADKRLWVVKASGAPDPHPLMPTGDVISAFLVTVSEGTSEKDRIWLQTANTVTVGSGSPTWSVVNSSSGLAVSDIPDGALGWDLNLLVNSSFRVWTHGATNSAAPTPSSFSTVADDIYGGPDRWNFLRESATIQIKQVSGRSGYSSYGVELKNNSGGNDGYFGVQQILESGDTLNLRGSTVAASVLIQPQTETKTYSLIIMEWTGTADSVTSDVVNDWTDATIAEGNFITSSGSHAIIGSATLSCSTGSWQQLTVSATVGSSANNLIVLCAQHGTGNSMTNNASTQLTEFVLYRGSVVPTYREAPIAITEMQCMRWHVCMSGAGVSDFYKSGRKVLTNRIRAFYDALPVPMRVSPTCYNNVSGWTAGAPGTTTIAGYDEMGSAYLTITGALTFLFAAYDRFRWTAKAEAGTSFSGTTGNYVEMAFGEGVVLHFSAVL